MISGAVVAPGQLVVESDVKKVQQIKQQVMAGKPAAKNTGNIAGKGGGNAIGGSRVQWLSLLNILQAGGREAQGGQGKVDFGVATNNRTVFLSKVARQEKNEMIPYEKLPSYIRQGIKKAEYEKIEVRGSENEPEVSGSQIGLLPVVIFSFSKKKCEELADYFKGQDMLTNREKGRVGAVIAGVLQRLSPIDTELPQINRMRELLQRGIGVHHSGLLPILKETVEMLFSQSLVKVLLATETFAMGVNMPARSVVFNGYRKHDGRQFRDLLPGEYIQMAGRAGRRGLDKVGTVIITVWGDLPADVNIKRLLTGQPTLLSSQFRLRYNMILNLIRADNMSVEDMMRRSFTEFSAQKALAGHDLHAKMKSYETALQYLESLQNQYDEVNALYSTEGSSVVTEITQYVEYFQSAQEMLYKLLLAIDEVLSKSKLSSSIDAVLPAGRALQMHTKKTGKPAYAVVLSCPSKTASIKQADSYASSVKAAPVSQLAASRAALMGGGGTAAAEKETGILSKNATVLALVTLDANDLPEGCKQVAPTPLTSVDLKTVPNEAIYACLELEDKMHHFLVQELSVKDIGIIYDSILSIGGVDDSNVDVSMVLSSVTAVLSKKLPSQLNILKVQKNTVSSALEIADMNYKLMSMTNLAYEYVIRPFPCLSAQYLNLHKMRRINEKLALIRHAISSASISLFPEFRQRRNVLQQLGYIQTVNSNTVYKHSVFDAQAQNDRHVITKKGRVCCELNTCDELIGTEMLFHNVLEPLNPPEIAGILSALVFQEKNDVEEVLTSRMETARQQMMEIFHQLSTLQQCEDIEVDPDVTGNKPLLNFGLCSVVYQWARGVAFKDIVSITEFQEGSIVRSITRLDELCRDIQNAARVMGNQSLYYKMEAVSQCIKRDIVFAASLYIA
ncbi:hypothetical protein EON65_22965 [archaeon]|nr:MAG: hypothetical protein EON65_22965 [archaeon]